MPLLNDNLPGGTTSFHVLLSNPTGGAVLGTTTDATVSIVDPDKGVSFRFSAYSFAEDFGEAVIGIARADLGDQPMSVDVETSDLTAQDGADYTGFHQTVVLPGAARPFFLNVPILNNQTKDGDRTFRITMSNPSEGSGLGIATASVRIERNNCTVTPAFDSGLVIQEESGAVTLRWSGDGGLQRADRVTGPWQTLTTAKSPWRVEARGKASFYRVTHPRPTTIYVPSSYDPATPMPLVFLFHGAGDSGQAVESYMQFRPLAESRGFFYCYPDGSMSYGYRVWSATDVDHDPSADWGAPIPDDPGYARELIEEITRRFNVDRKRIYMVGRSNGADMAWRMGAQFADLVAGISAQAHSGFWDADLFIPSEPVHVLSLQSLEDNYWGNAITLCDGFFVNAIAAPSIERTIRDWAGYNGASHPLTDPEPTMDLIYDVNGLDTVVTRYLHPPAGGAVELWTLTGGPHKPCLTPNYSPAIIDWLLAHPKP